MISIPFLQSPTAYIMVILKNELWRDFLFYQAKVVFVFTQENYVNIKQIKTDKNSKHTTHKSTTHRTSANPSQPSCPKFQNLYYRSPKIWLIGEVTVLNQKNNKRRHFLKGLYTGSGEWGTDTSSLQHQKHNAEGFQWLSQFLEHTMYASPLPTFESF